MVMDKKSVVKAVAKTYADKFGAVVSIGDTAGVEIMEVLVKSKLPFAWYFNKETSRYQPSFSLVGDDGHELVENLTSWGIRFVRKEHKPNPDLILVSLGVMSLPSSVVPV